MTQPFKELLAELEMISFSDRKTLDEQTAAHSVLLADFFETLPFPAWIKIIDADGKLRMAYVNEAYEKHIGISIKEYFSKEDSEMWGPEEVLEFSENDKQVLDTRAAIETAENINPRLGGLKSVWKGHKWPIIRNDGVIAVCGYALLPVIKEA